MTQNQIERIIVKYISNEANMEELEILNEWLKNNHNELIFKDFIKTNYTIDYSMNTYNADRVKQLLENEIKKKRSVFYKRRMQSVLKYAAIAILFIAVGYFYQQGSISSNSNSGLIIKDEQIVLEMENGTIQIINADQTKVVKDANGKIIGNQNKDQIAYASNIDSKILEFNTLKVPYGKRFEIVLSDGTQVHLNAGTSIKYPVNFIEGQKREVFLTGEAFFDVAHDSKHPFVVNTNEVNVQVLGTQFNVSKYAEDEFISTVLVKGKVGVYPSDKLYDESTATIIEPSYAAQWNRSEQNMTVAKVNTQIYTAWMNGKLIFKHLPFKNIIKKLERQYNVTIINKNTGLGNEFFTASFDIETIEEVMTAFQKNYNINFHIENNKIIIN